MKIIGIGWFEGGGMNDVVETHVDDLLERTPEAYREFVGEWFRENRLKIQTTERGGGYHQLGSGTVITWWKTLGGRAVERLTQAAESLADTRPAAMKPGRNW